VLGIDFDFSCAFFLFENARLDNRLVKLVVCDKIIVGKELGDIVICDVLQRFFLSPFLRL